MLQHTHSDDECSLCGELSGWDGCRVLGTRALGRGMARGAANALTSLWNGGLTGKREQEILTATWILEALQQEWGGCIMLDPCSDASEHVGCLRRYVHPAQDGLALPWYDRTYCNPPYGDLKAWLAKAMLEHVRWKPAQRIALLCPVRTHRPWYRQALDTTTAVVELASVKFHGYDQAFPAPLHLLCWGWTPTPALWRGTVRRYQRIDQ